MVRNYLYLTAFDNTATVETRTTTDDLLKRSQDSAAMLEYWDLTDAIVDGYKAVRDAGEIYLPRFNDETKEDYDIRLKLTKFTNIYRDIVESLASKPFEEEISLNASEKSSKAPQQITDFIENVDGAGNNITVFSSLAFFNAINSAIEWIFIDYPTVDRTKVKTRADQKASGARPFWSHVLGRNILEVRSKIIKDKQEITYIRIFEPNSDGKDRIRIFYRDESGVVTWELWEVVGDQTIGNEGGKFVLIDEGILSIDTIPLVPIITGRRDGTSWRFFPAMRDAADLQIQLYQDESGLKFIKTMTAFPILAANGMLPELSADGKTPKKLAISPKKVLYGRPDANGNHGTWTYVEPSAQSLNFLSDDIKETKQDLRELGRQPLTAQSGNLTVITTAVAAGKSRSAVAAWALALKDALENALVITNKYENIQNYDPEVNVYTDFDNFVEGGEDLQALGTARSNGDLSLETYWNELRRRKVLAPEFSPEEERKRLLKEIPSDGDIDIENG